MTAYGTVETAVAAMKEGAYDFITKPLKRHAVVKSVRQALEKSSLVAENRALKARLAALAPARAAGSSATRPPSAPCSTRCARRRPTSATVLLARRERHRQGARRAARARPLPARGGAPSCPINCAAIPESLLESELFGHERGAFTGAIARKEGRLRARPRRHPLPRRGRRDAAGRAGEAPARPAGRRARARGRHRAAAGRRARRGRHQQGPRRGGAGRPRSARTSSTGSTWSRSGSRPCASAARTCPCSRSPSCAASRREAREGGDAGSRRRRSRPSSAYAWPGNVRELQHAIERAVVLRRGRRDRRRRPARGDPLRGAAPPAGAAPPRPASLVIPLGTPLEEIERLVIRETLRQTKGDKNLAAQILGIAARTIYRKLDRDEEGRLVEPTGARRVTGRWARPPCRAARARRRAQARADLPIWRPSPRARRLCQIGRPGARRHAGRDGISRVAPDVDPVHPAGPVARRLLTSGLGATPHARPLLPQVRLDGEPGAPLRGGAGSPRRR